MPLKELPEGYGSTSEGFEPPADVAKQQFEPDPSVIDMILSAPSAISQAISGEGVPIEFPDLPELTDMGSDAPGKTSIQCWERCFGTLQQLGLQVKERPR